MVGTICEKLSKETNDGESDLEEARVSRNLFDLFEQSAQAEATTAAAATPEEEASTRARKEQDQQTQEKTKNQERGDAGQSGKGEQQEPSVQDTITFLHGLLKSKPMTLILTDEETQQWMEWRCLLRRIASDLSEKRFTVLGLKNAIDENKQLWSKGTHGLGGPTPGAKRSLRSLDALRKRTEKLMATERQVLVIADA